MSVAESTVLRVVMSFLLPTEVIAQNVLYLVPTGGSPPYDEQDLLDDIAVYLDLILDELEVIVDTEVSFDQFQVYEYDPSDDDWDEVGADTIVWSGISSDEMLPHGVAGHTIARSLDPDVSGSKYWPGITENFCSDGIWTAPGVTALAAAAAAWVAGDVGGITGALLTAGVWSVVQTNFRAFTGTVLTSNLPAYQRRRKPGVGT